MSDETPQKKVPLYTPKQLRVIRKRELGLSREKLAELAECDSKTIWRYETGKSPIKPGFIREVERLRAEERERRASDEIDFDSVPLPPGRWLIKLVPESSVDGEPPTSIGPPLRRLRRESQTRPNSPRQPLPGQCEQSKVLPC
jgi:hypothetical protein